METSALQTLVSSVKPVEVNVPAMNLFGWPAPMAAQINHLIKA